MTTLSDRMKALQQKIADAAQVSESLEWYLENNLSAFFAVLDSDAEELDLASRKLLRFFTESMDWDVPLYRECVAIAEEGRRLAKG